MEATGGFEPPNRGFADPRLRPLGYVAPRLLSMPGWRLATVRLGPARGLSSGIIPYVITATALLPGVER